MSTEMVAEEPVADQKHANKKLEKHPMKRLIISTSALGAALISIIPAFAQEQTSVRVSYGDLNLYSAVGVAALDRRMNAAVAQICGAADLRDLGAQALVKACRASTLATAERQARQIVAAARQAETFEMAKADPAP